MSTPPPTTRPDALASPGAPGPTPPPARGRSLRSLLGCEEASAAVEFVVLIPVYLMLLVGLFMMGNLLMARQALVAAVRFQAWSPKDPSSLSGFADNGKAFFGPYPGRFTPQGRRQSPVTLARGRADRQQLQLTGDESSRISSGGLQGLSDNARAIAADALNNGNDAPFLLTEVEASFTYDGVRLLATPPISQTASAAVLLPRKHTRKEYEPGSHPLTEWGQPPYDPFSSDALPLSPLFGRYFIDAGGADKGIWNREGRIGGDAGREWMYYRQKMR